MKQIISTFTQTRPLAAFLLLVSIAILATAYISQYVFHYDPCVLCLYQRKPYFAVIVLSLLALVVACKKPCLARWLLVGCAGAFAVGIGLAFYHTGVEQTWWAGTQACGGGDGLPASGDIEALRAYLENKKVTRCDVPTWKLFGLSMTVYNLIASTALFGFSALMLWLGRCRKAA